MEGTCSMPRGDKKLRIILVKNLKTWDHLGDLGMD
jgi:hypothetical protein